MSSAAATRGPRRSTEPHLTPAQRTPVMSPGSVPTSGAHGPIEPLARVTHAEAKTDRLYFAQVREDPVLELEALGPAMDGTVVVISSGGCTALSILAAGGRHVVAVDANSTQNHIVELKAAAIATFEREDALAFLGGAAAPPRQRLDRYAHLRASLTPPARHYWDSRSGAIARGVINAGVSERFISVLAAVIRYSIHPPRRVRRMLACRTLDEQRELYAREWDTRRWRLFFRVVLNRWVFDRAYDPTFFRNVENPSFAEHFYRLAEHALTRVPVANNYFLHQMLTGVYPARVPDGVPPYLSEAGVKTVRAARHRLALVDGTLTTQLRQSPDRSISGFAISNIGEWLTGADLDALFGEIVRTAAPGARLVFRNFVGWTEVPARWSRHVVEDRAAGEALIAKDRSTVQRRLAVCRVNSQEE